MRVQKEIKIMWHNKYKLSIHDCHVYLCLVYLQGGGETRGRNLSRFRDFTAHLRETQKIPGKTKNKKDRGGKFGGGVAGGVGWTE